MKIEKSSNLPASIRNANVSFDTGEKKWKFEVGPAKFMPGPIFDSDVKVAEKFVTKS